MLKPHRILVLGTVVLTLLLQIRLAYAIVPPPIPPSFVAVTGPHGITVLIGPLIHSPNGGYEREVILPGQQPFMVSTDPGVTPQEIADVYG
jgi:hypothetical protein